MHINIELFRINSLILTQYKDKCKSLIKEYSLNQTEFDIIMFLANNPNYNSAKDICEIRGLKSGIASVAIQKLVTKGYIKRINDSDDRRIQRLEILPKSNNIIKEGKLFQNNFLKFISRKIAKEDIDAFSRVVNQVLLNLKEKTYE